MLFVPESPWHLSAFSEMEDEREKGSGGRGRVSGLWGSRQRCHSLASCPGLSPSAAPCDSLPPPCCFPCYFWSHPLIPSAVLRWQCPNPMPPSTQKPVFLTDPKAGEPETAPEASWKSPESLLWPTRGPPHLRAVWIMTCCCNTQHLLFIGAWR